MSDLIFNYYYWKQASLNANKHAKHSLVADNERRFGANAECVNDRHLNSEVRKYIHRGQLMESLGCSDHVPLRCVLLLYGFDRIP